MNTINQELLDFISESPSMFHTAASISRRLEQNGFVRLSENKPWQIALGGKYYVTRNGSSIIAFTAAEGPWHWRIGAAHGDSPTYKLKSNPLKAGPAGYLRLDVEAYGGMIDSTWLDRPLTIAGRVLVRENDTIVSRLLYIDRDLFLIPNQPIHFNRDVNSGYNFNHAVDLCPLVSAGAMKPGDFNVFLGKELHTEPDRIAARDLYLVSRQKGCVWGIENEFISAPRLDDLQCAFSGLTGFLAAARRNPGGVMVYCCFDNEEVGSGTKQGAVGTFLTDVLHRLNRALGHTEEEYLTAAAGSFFLSADNAHAVHPNHPEKFDPDNASFLNRGVVIKENAAQRYMTDAFSRAVVSALCAKAGIPWQTFANRSDIRGGSTLGNLSTSQLSIHGADIGLPQLAMHSSYETAGARDTEYAVRLFETFYSTLLSIEGSDSAVLG
ncbi:MAG: M18 family aminopeptidase [Clostridia bacterium]|nr:M18 family aminopeptidase [Clostridia bacterium]